MTDPEGKEQKYKSVYDDRMCSCNSFMTENTEGNDGKLSYTCSLCKNQKLIDKKDEDDYVVWVESTQGDTKSNWLNILSGNPLMINTILELPTYRREIVFCGSCNKNVEASIIVDETNLQNIYICSECKKFWKSA